MESEEWAELMHRLMAEAVAHLHQAGVQPTARQCSRLFGMKDGACRDLLASAAEGGWVVAGQEWVEQAGGHFTVYRPAEALL